MNANRLNQLTTARNILVPEVVHLGVEVVVHIGREGQREGEEEDRWTGDRTMTMVAVMV
jgi:hypothetical protein